MRQIRAAGRVAGTLAPADEMPHCLEKGVQYFYVHSHRFLRVGMDGVKEILRGAAVVAE